MLFLKGRGHWEQSFQFPAWYPGFHTLGSFFPSHSCSWWENNNVFFLKDIGRGDPEVMLVCSRNHWELYNFTINYPVTLGKMQQYFGGFPGNDVAP